MLVSTKGRYAISVMIDLAGHNSGEYIPLTDIADRQNISEKYLESIVSLLSRSGLLDSLRGKGGGYRLNRQPDQYTVLEILECTEGSLAPVSLLENSGKGRDRTTTEPVMKMWQDLYKLIQDYFRGITVEDLMEKDEYMDYVI